ncbi:succinylglutamate desuccinylase/aspartoacylase family protein [Bradyrhizobium cytisi]|uniref:succinylglutamate desuccinylase/aspartoacylase family protein n=1 Tax=Bradyrhizobium cytisi TaxID=515489 RepID=UPI0024C0255F|nr:succinylglutamate desuccinylase/aspartoacylase family protein [Bradyrhizobium cytisi]
MVVDLHSGGKTMQFKPFACIHKLEDRKLQARSLELLLAFGAPCSLVLEEIDNGGMLDTTVEQSGKLFLAAELGGGGSASATTVSIADRGLRNVLCHLGIVHGKSALVDGEQAVLDTSAAGAYLHSNHDGLFEMLAELGQVVRAGDPIAQVHSLTDPSQEPIIYKSNGDGVLIGRHFPGLIKQGDFLALVAAPQVKWRNEFLS